MAACDQTKFLARNVDTFKFIAELEARVNIWNHKIPDHFMKAKDEFVSLALDMDSSGKRILIRTSVTQ